MKHIYGPFHLDVWKESHQLCLSIYTICKAFPNYERFGLSDQLRRASVSVVLNIVEGYGRQSINDALRFYNISHSSLLEVYELLLLSKDLEYISQDDLSVLQSQCKKVQQLLHGFYRSKKSSS